ncbi:hypothetical protein HMPREF1211_05211 [Streptomyces sp. HGB0020]|jgi:hypothetical protein|nr:hypothetical protein HMPREF1211_05211 [Streptomyces sp. HGB0020]
MAGADAAAVSDGAEPLKVRERSEGVTAALDG